MSQEELDAWYKQALCYFPDDYSKREGYLEALEDLAEKLGLAVPSRD